MIVQKHEEEQIFISLFFFYIQVIHIKFKKLVGYGDSQNIYIADSISCDKKIKEFLVIYEMCIHLNQDTY